MKIKIFYFIFFMYCLISGFTDLSYAYELDPSMVERDKEKLTLHKIYTLPMNAISDILEDGLLHCNRLPDEKEFRDFLLKGPNPNIRCTQAINLKPKIPKTSDVFKSGAQNRVDLQDFLNKHKLQVFSDTKSLYVILNQDSKTWPFKHYKAQDYELLIYCAYKISKCFRTTLDMQIKSCRNNPSFGRNFCYLGDKKVIDYD